MEFITWKDIVEGIVTGVVSSVIFLYLLWNLKPNFSIGDKISCEKANLNGEIVDLYFFKIINRSLFFKVYDVKVLAKVCTPVKNINGSNSDHSIINIPYNTYQSVSRFNYRHYFQDFIWGESTLEGQSNYALRFFTTHNLRKILENENKSINFEVIARHSLTGFTRVQEMKFHHKTKIENGSFLTGNSFKIVKKHEPTAINTD